MSLTEEEKDQVRLLNIRDAQANEDKKSPGVGIHSSAEVFEASFDLTNKIVTDM